jgi:hypothetical protein
MWFEHHAEGEAGSAISQYRVPPIVEVWVCRPRPVYYTPQSLIDALD